MSMTLNFLAHSLERGRRLQEAGKAKEAAQLFDHLGQQSDLPKEIAFEALMSLGQFRLEVGEIAAARHTLASACERDPHSAAAQFSFAQACLAGDDADLEQAHEALREAAELEPNAAEYRAELGKVQIALGMEEDGMESLELACQLEPANPLYLRDVVDALMDLGNEVAATSRVRQAMFQNPRIPGFKTLWNDLRFCLTADEIDADGEPTLPAVSPSKLHILQFPQTEVSETKPATRRRTIRQDGASELQTPHTHLPFVKPDRRLA
jgi:tetratricopeptide (TPR) repeat protein